MKCNVQNSFKNVLNTTQKFDICQRVKPSLSFQRLLFFVKNRSIATTSEGFTSHFELLSLLSFVLALLSFAFSPLSFVFIFLSYP